MTLTSEERVRLNNQLIDIQRKNRFRKRTNEKLSKKLVTIHRIITEAQSLKSDPSNSFSAADLGNHYDQVLSDILALIDV